MVRSLALSLGNARPPLIRGCSCRLLPPLFLPCRLMSSLMRCVRQKLSGATALQGDGGAVPRRTTAWAKPSLGSRRAALVSAVRTLSQVRPVGTVSPTLSHRPAGAGKTPGISSASPFSPTVERRRSVRAYKKKDVSLVGRSQAGYEAVGTGTGQAASVKCRYPPPKPCRSARKRGLHRGEPPHGSCLNDSLQGREGRTWASTLRSTSG